LDKIIHLGGVHLDLNPVDDPQTAPTNKDDGFDTCDDAEEQAVFDTMVEDMDQHCIDDPESKCHGCGDCELAQNHYLCGISFGRFGEYTFPYAKIRDQICDHFDIPKPPLEFSNQGYLANGRAYISRNGLTGDKFVQKIILYKYGAGLNVETLIHEIAHTWGYHHDREFMIAHRDLLRWTEDNLIPPPKGHLGWREKLAKKYVAIYGGDIGEIDSFIVRHNLDLSTDDFLDMIINQLPI